VTIIVENNVSPPLSRHWHQSSVARVQ